MLIPGIGMDVLPKRVSLPELLDQKPMIPTSFFYSEEPGLGPIIDDPFGLGPDQLEGSSLTLI